MELVAQEPDQVRQSDGSDEPSAPELGTAAANDAASGPDVRSVDDGDREVSRPNDDLAAKPVALGSQPAAAVRALQIAHDAITNKRNRSEDLAAEIFVAFGFGLPKRDHVLANALKAVGVTRGIVSSHHATAVDRSWLQGDKQILYRYVVDYQLLMPELETFVNSCFGDALFEDVLEGLKTDVDGPRIDVRKELIDCLASELFIILDLSAKTESGCALMVALRLGVKRIFVRSVRPRSERRHCFRISSELVTISFENFLASNFLAFFFNRLLDCFDSPRPLIRSRLRLAVKR